MTNSSMINLEKLQFDSLAAFIDMGGHGVFVWTVYALVLVVLVFLTWLPLHKKRSFFVQQAMLARREQAAQQRAGAETAVPDNHSTNKPSPNMPQGLD